MASDNTSPRAGTRTAEADGTQPLEPVTAPGASGTNGSADASNGSTTTSSNGSGGAPKVSEAPTPSADATAEPAGTGTPTTTSVKEGAVKAAAAALAAARSAAKKVQSTASSASASAQTASAQNSGAPSSTPPPPPGASQGQPRPQMHYSAGGVSGSAQASPQDEGTYASQSAQEAPVEAGSPRRVRLSVSRIDPWSIMKLAFLLSVAIAIMTVVATIVAWHSLNSLHFFATVQEFMTDTLGPQAANLTQFVAFERVVSLATLIALVNIVLMTAIATIMTMLYNITAALVGGVHLTLTDE